MKKFIKKIIENKNFIIVVLFSLYICFEIVLSSVPFATDTPTIITRIFQRPSNESKYYLALNILKNLLIGALGAVIYDFFMIQLPKHNNLIKHSLPLKNIVYNIENIISVYLLSNNCDTNFSNLNDDDLKETKLCLTNEAIYYKDVHGDHCGKSYIFNTYKNCVNEIIESSNKILSTKYPITEKYEEIIDGLVKNDFIQLIDKKKYPDVSSAELPLQPSMFNAFRFNYKQIIDLHNIYSNVKKLVEEDYELSVYSIVDKAMYLDSFYEGMLFYADRLVEKEYNLSFVEDVKEEILLLKQFDDEDHKEKYNNIFYYLYIITKDVNRIYFEKVNMGDIDSEFFLKTWVDLLKFCMGILNDVEKHQRIYMLLPLSLFKQHLKMYDEDDEKFLREFYDANSGYFGLEEKFNYYVLTLDKDKAKEIYENSNLSFKQEIVKSPYWNAYLNL